MRNRGIENSKQSQTTPNHSKPSYAKGSGGQSNPKPSCAKGSGGQSNPKQLQTIQPCP